MVQRVIIKGALSGQLRAFVQLLHLMVAYSIRLGRTTFSNGFCSIGINFKQLTNSKHMNKLRSNRISGS